MSDLCRQMQPLPTGLQVDFIRMSSYIGIQSQGKVAQTLQSKVSLAGRHVLVVEDIVDTGGTLRTLLEALQQQGAASVKTVALLNKTEKRKVDVPVDYCCFECPDEFVIGYGLDFNESFRSLPYVGVLKAECYR
eukprot:jgi/Astpho2/4282/e_gw1.00064.136.1_t